MSNLFKKAAIFTDIHYGLKGNSDLHNQDCIDFTKWFIDEAKKEQCETCFFLGDYHNNRNSMNLKTMSYALAGLELLSKNFDQTYFIPGNHDLFFRDKRDVHSVSWASHIPNITIINDWFKQGDVVIAPWLVGDDYKKIKKYNAKYMFGHFELPGYLMNAMVRMPDTGEISKDDFCSIEHVFSGHFHKRQTQGNVTYIGNAFPHNYSDTWDDERGMTILEWGKDPVYRAWPAQPTFRTISLSQLIDKADQIILPNQYLRVLLDIDVSFEESSFIKEKFLNDYNIRELSLISEKKFNEVESEADLVSFESVDQIVNSQIEAIESDKFDKNILLSIYNNL